MRIAAMLVVAIMLLAGCGSATQQVNPENSINPTNAEKAVVDGAIPEGMKVGDSRRIGTTPPFVFAGYIDGQYKLQLKIFEMNGDKPAKTYDTGVFEGESIFFNSEVENSSWGKPIGDCPLVLPVSIFMGGNDWSRSYVKFFTIKDNVPVEIPVVCEPGLVAGLPVETDGRLVVPVYDSRFQFFNDLPHAASPSRVYIFDYDAASNSFVDKTASFPGYMKKVIDELKKMAEDSKDIWQSQQAAMISLYIQAEAAGMTEQVMTDIENYKNRYPNEPMIVKSWEQIQDAYTNKKPFASFAPWGDEMDLRWQKLAFKVEESK
jgi:hypothetical protein